MMDPDDAARYPLAPGYRDSDPVPDPTWADPASEVVLRVSKLLYAVLMNLALAWILWGWWWQLAILPMIHAGAWIIRTLWEIAFYFLSRRTGV
jgi:hypothetical protein